MKRVLLAAVACTSLLSGSVEGVPLNMMKTEEQAALSLQSAMAEVNADITDGSVDADDIFKDDDSVKSSATAIAASMRVPTGVNKTAEAEALKRAQPVKRSVVNPETTGSTGATGVEGATFSTGPEVAQRDFGEGDTGITGAESSTGGARKDMSRRGTTGPTGSGGATGAMGKTGATGLGISTTGAATMIPEEDEANEREDPPESALAHSKQLSDSVVEKVKFLANSLHDDTVGQELESTAKRFLEGLDVVQKKLLKTMGSGVAYSPEYLKNRYPDEIATCERVTAKKILSKIRDNLFSDAAYAHEALVEKLPRTDEVKTMISNTADLLKESTQFVNNIPRCVGECNALKSKAVVAEGKKRQLSEDGLRLKCVQEQVQVEKAMADKIKLSDEKAEIAEDGMLRFSKAVVEMSEKINKKKTRIKELKEKLATMQKEIQTMEMGSQRSGKGKVSPAKMLSNIRTKCMQEAAELSNVEVEENHELLKEVSKAKKLAIAMQERSIQLNRQLSMEMERAPNFSNEELCKATLEDAKDKMMLPNPLSDKCNECHGISKVDKEKNMAYCVWGGSETEEVVQCEEIAFLSGDCQPPKGLPSHCYDAVLYGPKAIRDYLKRHGFPLFTPPAEMSILGEKELEEQLNEETGGKGQSVAEQLRRQVEEMNKKFGIGEDDEEEEDKNKKRGTGATGAVDSETGNTGETGSTGETGATGGTGGVRGSVSGGTGGVSTGSTGVEDEGKTEIPAGPDADMWN